MQYHEREYFVARVRSGIYPMKIGGLSLKVYGATIEEELEIQEIYVAAYDNAVSQGILTQEDILDWMTTRGLWSQEDETKILGLEKDLEKLKVEAYNNRNNQSLLSKIKPYLRAGESQLAEVLAKKNQFSETTCEGIAAVEKGYAYIERCTYCDGKLYDFGDIRVPDVLHTLYSLVLSDSECRELARNEPWKSLWFLNDSRPHRLFNNNGREFTIDQKNILIWSKMYHNIQESPDCPSDDVIDDDDMLDGWFVLQKRKREQERAEAELESSTKNQKIKNANEVFVMTSPQDAERVERMNDATASMIKKQRMDTIKKRGSVGQAQLPDEQLKLSNMSAEMYRDKFKRG